MSAPGPAPAVFKSYYGEIEFCMGGFWGEIAVTFLLTGGGRRCSSARWAQTRLLRYCEWKSKPVTGGCMILEYSNFVSVEREPTVDRELANECVCVRIDVLTILCKYLPF